MAVHNHAISGLATSTARKGHIETTAEIDYPHKLVAFVSMSMDCMNILQSDSVASLELIFRLVLTSQNVVRHFFLVCLLMYI